MLLELREVQARFNEKKRIYDLSREARLLKDPSLGSLKVTWPLEASPCYCFRLCNAPLLLLPVQIKILRPRAQLVGLEKRILEAYVDFIVEVPVTAKGKYVKQAIIRKQEALVLPTMPDLFMRLFIHELGGRQVSQFVGREVR